MNMHIKVKKRNFNTHIDHTNKTICGKDYTVEKSSDGRNFRVIVSGVMHPAGKLPIRFKSFERAAAHLLNHSRHGSYQPISYRVPK